LPSGLPEERVDRLRNRSTGSSTTRLLSVDLTAKCIWPLSHFTRYPADLNTVELLSKFPGTLYEWNEVFLLDLVETIYLVDRSL